LFERKQCVSISDQLSPYLDLNDAIPQGTKLGPILFAIMANDLVSSWGPRVKFVDDLTVLEIIPRNCPSLLQHVVNDIQSFANTINMQLIPKKCKSMSVSFLQYNSYQCQPIVVGDMVIESVKSFRFLGLHISCDLTWSVHCDFVLKRANRRLYALRKLKHSGVPPSDLVQVYCALVRSTIEYSSAIYSSLPSYLADLIECI